MPASHDHDTTGAAATSDVDRATAGRRGLIAGAAVLLACAAACSLPVLLAGAAAVSVGALASGAEPIAVGALLLTALVAGGLRLRRRRAPAAGVEAGCGCGRGCGC